MYSYKKNSCLQWFVLYAISLGTIPGFVKTVNFINTIAKLTYSEMTNIRSGENF
jgi:hypothetical protein